MIPVIALLIIPGYLLEITLHKYTKLVFLEKIPFWFCLSVGLFVIPSLATYLFAKDLKFAFNFYFLILIILLISAIVTLLRRQDSEKVFNKIRIEEQGVLLLALLSVPLMYHIGGFMEIDTNYHLAIIKKILTRPRVSSLDATFVNGGVDPAYAYSTWHLLLALFSEKFNIDILTLWFRLPAILAPISIITCFVFVRKMFQNGIIGFLSAYIMFLFYAYGKNCVGFQTLVFPFGFCMAIFIPFTLFWVFRYIHEERKFFLIMSAICAFVFSTIYMVDTFFYLISMFSFSFFSFVFNKKETAYKVLKVIVSSLLISLPFLYIRSLDYGFSNPSSNPEIYLGKDFVKLCEKLFCISPNMAFGYVYSLDMYYTKNYWLPMVSFLFLPLVFHKNFRKENWTPLIFANLVIPPLIMLNPILMPNISKVIPIDYLCRLSELYPTYPVIGLFVYLIFKTLHKNVGKNVIIPGICIIIFTSVPSVFLYKNHYLKAKSINEIKNHPEVYDYLEEVIKKPSVILSDSETSYEMLPFVKHYVAAVTPFETSPTNWMGFDRIRDANMVLDPNVSLKQTLMIIDRHRVDFILLNLNLCPEGAHDKFQKNNQKFQEVYNNRGYIVFKVMR